MDEQERLKLSKTVAVALRHDPTAFGLTLDAQGWVPVEALLTGLRGHNCRFEGLAEADLAEMIALTPKRRYELADGRIRAYYGHSVSTEIERPLADPPPVLWHGTSHRAWPLIQVQGLRPMDRQFVHLSEDEETALTVGRRRDPAPVLLRVDTAAAVTAGVRFRLGNEKVWLSDPIPPAHLST